MADINLIDRPEAKSTARKVTEVGLTTVMWGLWLYLLMPLLNVLMWLVGLGTIRSELFEKGGYLQFIELVQQMGWVILITFAIMRLWGIYNYYRFGRHERRSHEMPDSMEKLAAYFGMEPQSLLQLEGRKETVWPHQDASEDVGAWLQQKAANLTPEQIRADEGSVLTRFRDTSGKGMPSITQSVLFTIGIILVFAGFILFSAQALQKEVEISAPAPHAAAPAVEPQAEVPAETPAEGTQTEMPAEGTQATEPVEGEPTEAPADATQAAAPADGTQAAAPADATQTAAPADATQTAAPAGTQTAAPADGSQAAQPDTTQPPASQP